MKTRTRTVLVFTSPCMLGFLALLFLAAFVAVERVNAGLDVTVSARVSNEINCEAEPQTNVYFDIIPAEGGEVAVGDAGVVRKFDALGSYEEEGLSGYFGNGNYQGQLSPKTGYALAQSSAFSFTVASQCDVNGEPIFSSQSASTTATEVLPLPSPPTPILAPETTTSANEPVPETQTVAETQTTTTTVPPLETCGSEEECAQLCTKGAGAEACADFASELIILEPLSSISTEETDVAAMETAVVNFFEERSGARAFTDTDQDGIADFDEVNLFGTDPKKADSDRDGVADGAELLALTNPTGDTSASGAAMIVEDPSTHGITASSTLVVATIVASATTTDASGVDHISSLTLGGKAPANSFVTLFIYSEPIVVSIKADDFGSWTYTLDRELPDGSHEVFVAVTDSGGRVLAKSNPLPFVQTASAITVGSFELLPPSEQAPTFFGWSGIATMAIFLLVIIIVVIFVLGMITQRNKDDGTGTPSAA